MFGESIASYSSAVSGIDTTGIIESATAAQAISDMANTIQNSGGMKSWFSGDNDLETFGEQLVSFGYSLAAYSAMVSIMDLDSITASKASFDVVVQMANENVDADLESLGEELRSLGQDMNSFYGNVKDIDSGTLTGISTGVTQVKTACSELANINTGAISELGTAVTSAVDSISSACSDLINNGMADFKSVGSLMMINISNGIRENSSSPREAAMTAGVDIMSHVKHGIDNTKTSVMSSIQNVLTGVIAEINRNNSNMSSAGSNLITNLITGINQKSSTVSTTVGNMCKNMNTAIRNYYSTFNSAGQYLANGLASGLQSGASNISSKISSSLRGAANTARGYYSDMYSAGSYMMQGLANGISANSYAAAAAAAAAASRAAQAARNALQIQSPSKVFAEIGKFMDLGLAKGIKDNSNIPEKSAEDTADQISNNLRTALESIVLDELELDPIIKPVLDLSEVKNGVGYINSKLGTKLAGSISSNMTISEPQQQTPITSNNTNNVEIINHFNITGDNAKDIANEVSRILQKQMERREAVWA